MDIYWLHKYELYRLLNNENFLISCILNQANKLIIKNQMYKLQSLQNNCKEDF